MKENINMKNKENFSLEVRKNGKTIEKISSSNRYSFRNDYNNEVEYSYALCKED
jgi:hypothetical protein